MTFKDQPPRVAIACGGTGGHLYPGLAVADALVAEGCWITLLVGSREIDRLAVRSAYGIESETLPAIGFSMGNLRGFLSALWASFQKCQKIFNEQRPDAVLAMGGFTSAAPVLAGKLAGARVLLHEANAVPGRAVRWLAPLADEVHVQFPRAIPRVLNHRVRNTGLPVRSGMEPIGRAEARTLLGLAPEQPTLLVLGGSQGARAVNELAVGVLPALVRAMSKLQFIHLTGGADFEKVKQAYDALGARAVVRPFLTEMEFALGAADLALSRAGASSLAEFAAMELPAVLIPYPTAVDDHQWFNARTFREMGAAHIMPQKAAHPALLAKLIKGLLRNDKSLEHMRQALRNWKAVSAAETVAGRILDLCQYEQLQHQSWMSQSNLIDKETAA